MMRAEVVTSWTVFEGATQPQLPLDYVLVGWVDTTGQQVPVPKVVNALVIEIFSEDNVMAQIEVDLGDLLLWSEVVENEV